MIDIGILNELNAPTKEERLDNLRRIAEKSVFPPMEPRYINNHIHTFYSFPPTPPPPRYTPPARRGSAPQA